MFCAVEFLLYFTRCCPLEEAVTLLLIPLPPGLAGRFVGALDGLPDWCMPPLADELDGWAADGLVVAVPVVLIPLCKA